MCYLELIESKDCCCCSVAKLYMTLCDPMDCSMPGLPVPYHLLEFAQAHFYWISDAIQTSHPLLPSAALFSFCLQSFPASESSNESAFCIKWWILKYIDLVCTLHHGEWDSHLTGYHLQYDALVALSKGCPIALSGQQLLCNMDVIGLADPMVMCLLFHLLCCKICFLISNIQCYVGSHVIGINILETLR